MPFFRPTFVLTLLVMVAGCQKEASGPVLFHPLMPVLPVPQTGHRTAVLYPRSVLEWAQASRRLEESPFQRKIYRPARILADNQDLPTGLAEHHFQLRGPVDENSAIHMDACLEPIQS